MPPYNLPQKILPICCHNVVDNGCNITLYQRQMLPQRETIMFESLRHRLRRAVRAFYTPTEAEQVYEAAAKAIEDYDRAEADGEDMSKRSVRPRMLGGSDW